MIRIIEVNGNEPWDDLDVAFFRQGLYNRYRKYGQEIRGKHGLNEGTKGELQHRK